MSLIKAIIIEDEEPARVLLKNYIKEIDDIELVDECENGFEGMKAIQEHEPDVVFLDIQMPKLTGFEMLEILPEKPEIIFTTAYDEYALKAFDTNAIDYLLKPFSKMRFSAAIEKMRIKLKTKQKKGEKIEKLQQYVEENTSQIERIVVRTGKHIKVIPIDKLRYIEAQDDYVKIHSEDGSYLKEKTMKYYEAVLNPNEFVRIHRSYIVRLSEITQLELYQKDSYLAILKDGTKLKASRTGYRKLRDLF